MLSGVLSDELKAVDIMIPLDLVFLRVLRCLSGYKKNKKKISRFSNAENRKVKGVLISYLHLFALGILILFDVNVKSEI